MSVVWEEYKRLSEKVPSKQIMAQTLDMDTERLANTGCVVLAGGLETLRKLRMPRSALIKSTVTLLTSDGTPLKVLGVVPVDITVRGSIRNTSRQLLHITSELPVYSSERLYCRSWVS